MSKNNQKVKEIVEEAKKLAEYMRKTMTKEEIAEDFRKFLENPDDVTIKKIPIEILEESQSSFD